jgi:transposase
MRGPYHSELRVRVIRFVEEGGSRREAAEQFDVSVSSAIRWVQRFHDDGTSTPMPRGGGVSPLEGYSVEILALAQEHPDLTLHEMVSALAGQGIPASRSALSRFFGRHALTHKKKSAGGRTAARRRGSGAQAVAARAKVA